MISTRTSTAAGANSLFAGLMVFNADFVSVPWMATKVEGNKDGSVWTFTIRKDSRWSDNSPVSRAGLRVVVEAPARSGHRGPLRLLPVRPEERRGVQQEAGHGREPGRRARQGRLDPRGDAGRARAATSRCSPPTWPPCRPTAARWRSTVTSGRRRQHRDQRAVHSRGLGAQQAGRAQEEPVLLRRQGRAPDPGGDPDHPGGLRRAALREQRARPDRAAVGRPQAAAVRPAHVEGRLPVPVPGHLVPAAADHEAAVRQPEGPQGGGARDRPGERGQGEPGTRGSRLVDDPAWIPGRDRRPQDQGHPEVRQEAGSGTAQGHALRGWQELAQDHALDAGRGPRLEAARGGGPGGAARHAEHEDGSGSPRAARVPRAPLEAGTAVRVDPLVHGLPGPAQRVLRHLLRQEDHRPAAGVGQRRLRQGAGGRAATPATRRSASSTTRRPRRSCSRTSATCRWPGWCATRPRSRGSAGIEKNKAGEFVVDGNIYVDMFEHIYITEKG